MGRDAATARGNIYFECRKRASIDDPRLGSREGAAELLNISPSTLADYELGKTKAIPIESVMRMADLYKAPFLKTRFCSCECPLGTACAVNLPTDQPAIETVVLNMASRMEPESLRNVRDDLIFIARDGHVNEDEKERLADIVQRLEEIARCTVGLRLIKAAAT